MSQCKNSPNRISVTVSLRLEATHVAHATEHNSCYFHNSMQPTKLTQLDVINSTFRGVPLTSLSIPKVTSFPCQVHPNRFWSEQLAQISAASSLPSSQFTLPSHWYRDRLRHTWKVIWFSLKPARQDILGGWPVDRAKSRWRGQGASSCCRGRAQCRKHQGRAGSHTVARLSKSGCGWGIFYSARTQTLSQNCTRVIELQEERRRWWGELLTSADVTRSYWVGLRGLNVSLIFLSDIWQIQRFFLVWLKSAPSRNLGRNSKYCV